MAKTLKVIVCGATGKTGSRVAEFAERDSRFKLKARIGRDSMDAFSSNLKDCNVVIDFTTPDATVGFAEACAAAHVPFVTGTTGLTAAQRAAVAEASRATPVFMAPNFSPGVAVLFHLASIASARLPNFNASIREIHHVHKKDSPSGTALRLKQSVSAARSSTCEIPIESLREGDAVGVHELTLVGANETVSLSHRAHSRDAFALGALEAAAWVVGKRPGLYDMSDLLSLK